MTESKTIGRKRKKNGFTQIANTLLEDSRLSWKAKALLCYLLSRPDNWKINKTDIQNRAIDGRESMQSGLNELKEIGYLHIYRNKLENGQFDGWIWEYDDIPFDCERQENRTTENPQEIGENMQESSSSGNPTFGEHDYQETRLYNNTEFNNTNYNNTKSKELKDIKTNSAQIEAEFEQLWKIYPRKEGKKKAFDSFKKARKVKKVPYETVENGLYRYVRHLEQQETDEQFIMHGSTWFNQEKWQDEYITTGINKKPKNAMEYFRMKHGGDIYESSRNGEIIDHHPEVLPEFF